jgi:hypothetical protein
MLGLEVLLVTRLLQPRQPLTGQGLHSLEDHQVSKVVRRILPLRHVMVVELEVLAGRRREITLRGATIITGGSVLALW